YPLLYRARYRASRAAACSRPLCGAGHIMKTAIVLAAGLGKRMRPLTDTMPKPMISIAGKTLLDRGLDALAAVGIGKAIVNVHYLPQQIIDHVAARTRPRIVISDESRLLLDSAGGIVKALP